MNKMEWSKLINHNCTQQIVLKYPPLIRHIIVLLLMQQLMKKVIRNAFLTAFSVFKRENIIVDVSFKLLVSTHLKLHVFI